MRCPSLADSALIRCTSPGSGRLSVAVTAYRESVEEGRRSPRCCRLDSFWVTPEHPQPPRMVRAYRGVVDVLRS